MKVLPVVCFAALMIYVGQRLIRSGLRSDGAELWLGLSFVPSGLAITCRFAVASGLDVGVDPVLANVVAQSCLHFGVACFAAFVWRTFRPVEAWARRLFYGVAALYTLNVVLFYATGAAANQSHPFHLLLSTCLSFVYGWGLVEALLFHRSMRKRAALGLADPVVTNRFALFGLWTGGMVLLPAIVSAVRVISMVSSGQGFTALDAGGAMVREDAQWALSVIRLAVLLIGLPMIAGIWLSFFPPGRYTRWLEARAAA